MREFCHGRSDGAGKPLRLQGEPVVRIVVLSGVENAYQKLVCLTLSGKVFLRSLDGRKSARAKPDLFIAQDGNAPVIIDA